MRLAADASAIFSIISSRAALRAITEGGVEIATTLFTIREVKRHLPDIAEKFEIAPGFLEERLAALDVKVYGPRKYRRQMPEARKRIDKRDPDDADLLALALTLKIAIRTHDKDFGSTGVQTYTTAQFLTKLGIRGS